MTIRLHKNATTTPVRRAYIQSSLRSVAALATELGASEDTIRRWKGRATVEDRSHTAHCLQTTLSPAQEAVVIALRQTLWLPLDNLLVVTREFIHERATRSGLHRLLQRRGLSRLPAEPKTEAAHKPFKAYAPGYLHLDVKYLPQMGDEANGSTVNSISLRRSAVTLSRSSRPGPLALARSSYTRRSPSAMGSAATRSAGICSGAGGQPLADNALRTASSRPLSCASSIASGPSGRMASSAGQNTVTPMPRATMLLPKRSSTA